MSASIHVQVLATNHSHCRDGEQYVNGTYIDDIFKTPPIIHIVEMMNISLGATRM